MQELGFGVGFLKNASGFDFEQRCYDLGFLSRISIARGVYGRVSLG